MDAALELTEAVAIVVLASAAEGITAGCTRGKAIFLATHLVAFGARLQPTGAVRTKPTGIIVAIHTLTGGLLAADAAGSDLTSLAGVNGQLVQVPMVLVAVNTGWDFAHAAHLHNLLGICLDTIQAGGNLFFFTGGANKEVIMIVRLFAAF